MERNTKQKHRSQLAAAIIVVIALIGVLVINTDRATAVRATTAAETGQVLPSNTATAETPGFFSSAMPSLLRLGCALVVVIAAIYLGLYGLKKMMGKKYSGNRQLNLLEVLETTYLAPKKSVSLVRVADKAVLVGMSESHITILTELDKEQTREILTSLNVEPEPESFSRIFKTATHKIKEFGLKRTGKTALET